MNLKTNRQLLSEDVTTTMEHTLIPLPFQTVSVSVQPFKYILNINHIVYLMINSIIISFLCVSLDVN